MKTSTRGKLAILALNLSIIPAGKVWAEETTVVQTNVNQSALSNFFTKEKWGASYFNYMNGPTFSESSGESINHYLALKHKFSPDWALSAVARPDSNFGNEKDFVTMADPYVRLDYPSFYKGENGLKIGGDLRYFAPVSESSQKAKLAGIVSPYVKVNYDVSRWSLGYTLIPKIYLNTITKEEQKIASHGHYLSAGYTLTPKVTFDLGVYPVWTMSRGQEAAFNDLPAYPGFTVNFSKDFSISPYMEIPLLKAESKAISFGGSLSYIFL